MCSLQVGFSTHSCSRRGVGVISNSSLDVAANIRGWTFDPRLLFGGNTFSWCRVAFGLCRLGWLLPANFRCSHVLIPIPTSSIFRIRGMHPAQREAPRRGSAPATTSGVSVVETPQPNRHQNKHNQAWETVYAGAEVPIPVSRRRAKNKGSRKGKTE